jgi:hypothetical protein
MPRRGVHVEVARISPRPEGERTDPWGEEAGRLPRGERNGEPTAPQAGKRPTTGRPLGNQRRANQMDQQQTSRATALGRGRDRRARRRVRRSALAAVVGLIAGLVPTLIIDPAAAVNGNQVTETLEGCRASADVYPINGPFVCDDADYTTGNLQDGWNELDLVPHRLTVDRSSNSSTDTYSVNLVADAIEGGDFGYDFISVPVINDALSDDSCEVSSGPLLTKTPGVGGTDTSIYRTVTITQDPDTVCVLDYYERLALGSSEYSGSSLHSNVTNEDFSLGGVGARDVSIPVNAILPQELEKDMSATQGASHVWNVTKEAQPAVLDFEDTCSADSGALQQEVQITVAWTKSAAAPSGDVTVTTNIYATNPAHRPLLVDVTDVIRSGTDVLDTHVFAQTALGALATELIGTHTLVVSAVDADNLNDIATGTYTDPVPGNPAIGLTTTATASATVQQTGTAENATATITDVESITGSGLSYSVDDFTGASGSYDGAYVEGTETSGNVSWTSDSQSDDGSVTFTKTVYVDEPMETTGTLSDVATLTGSDGFTDSANASVSITSDATTTLTIDKTIPNILQGAETVSFTFNVYEDASDPSTLVDSKVITFTAGETNKSVSFSLDPGVYDVTEGLPDGWETDLDGDDIDLTLPTCSAGLFVVNTPDAAAAEAIKVTDPVGSENGWEMCLTGPGTEGLPGGSECVTTSGTGEADFTTPLQEGGYTITETPQTGWDQTGADGCSFTVNFPADFNRTFTCTFTNTERGTVTVMKTSSGEVPPAGAFTFEIRSGASFTEPGTILDSDTNDATGEVDFDGLTDGLAPGTYQLCEAAMEAGWHSTLSDDPDAFVPDGDALDPDNSTICVPITLDPGEDLVVNVDNTPPPGGDARTIGYWRNWSSCTGGNQDPRLDEVLADAGGILIGDLLVDTCQEAVNILSKSDLNGVKRASDPAFNLAAQLLAAKLNQAAGAGLCPAAITAIADAQTLLADADFDGYRTFGGSSSKGKKGTASTGTINGATANSLASTLDAYNNNELC